MTRPAQVEQQVARVKELQDELLGITKPPVDPTTTDTDDQPPPTEPDTPAPVVDPPATISKAEYDKLEQRYRTLQGMHRAEAETLRGELSAARQAVQDLENRIVAQERANQTSSYTPAKYVTAEDEEEFGDTLDMVRRAAREEAENAAHKREQALLERINQLEATLGNVQNTVVPAVENISRAQEDQVKAEFWGLLNTQVPDWRTINADPAFIEWLMTEDPITGATRQQFLDHARHTYNGPRVVKFFEEFKRTAGGQTPAPKKNSQEELERYVAPGAARGSNPTPPEKKIWSSADISKFYEDVNKGVYRNKPDERKKMENDLFQAQLEGRVKQS